MIYMVQIVTVIVFSLVFLGLTLVYGQQPPSCEDRLANAEHLILVLRNERDRAQEILGQALAQNAKLAQSQKQAKVEEKP